MSKLRKIRVELEPFGWHVYDIISRLKKLINLLIYVCNLSTQTQPLSVHRTLVSRVVLFLVLLLHDL